ncbi:polysaccharide biosynthesis tyrosine autokinase [Nocardioides dongkuii]|uniref:polysaccharide biosynthesis tyrosine autokinase n=1 Tax=Nocardioides dongkuii TaxID=2760089 RepID=UPI0015F8CEF9|nr:polysaccharide biosynthesis tyrosine autokinase [Nocardioides dongkuii]
MELRDYVGVLRRRWMLVVSVALVVVAVASLYTFTATPMYQSTAKMFVSTTSESDAVQSGNLTTQRVASYADLVVGESRARAVIADLGLDLDPDELASKVTAEVTPETNNLLIRATDADSAEAQRIAQGYADEMEDLVDELETPPDADVAVLKAVVVDPASLPEKAVSPQPVRNLALGLVLGLLLGVGLAVLREVLDTTVKGFEDLAAHTDAPLLGTIAFDPATRLHPLVTDLSSHAPRVEAFRVLRTNIQFVDVDQSSKLFVVTSALPEEGKTTTSVNLAITLAQAGGRTLLVEADLRRPKAVAALGLDNAVGVTTILVGKVKFEDAVQVHESTGLHVLASGAVPPNPADLLQSRAMAELLSTVRGRYDTVVIDAPPLLPVTDAALLASQADGALLVVRWGKTTRDQFSNALGRLDQVGAEPVGVVLNMVPHRRGGGSYGYGYGYGYGYAPTQDVQALTAAGTPDPDQEEQVRA